MLKEDSLGQPVGSICSEIVYQVPTLLIAPADFTSNLEMEAARYSETSIDFQRTTWRYIPEDIAHQTGKKTTTLF
jgi:hypothetical protein